MKLTTLTGADALGGSNVAFIHPDSEHAHRLGAWRQANGA